MMRPEWSDPWWQTVRCAEPTCRTSINLDNDPATLCDTCGQVTCWACEHRDCEGRQVEQVVA